ncbi:hypothetical protein BKA69DRAFT_1088628 [Paraphysoderma sedebokerense]|nr:hypothetical protein BKA69DRAFT_1088628 [Paraphysoderma sedebokerense]
MSKTTNRCVNSTSEPKCPLKSATILMERIMVIFARNLLCQNAKNQNRTSVKNMSKLPKITDLVEMPATTVLPMLLVPLVDVSAKLLATPTTMAVRNVIPHLHYLLNITQHRNQFLNRLSYMPLQLNTKSLPNTLTSPKLNLMSQKPDQAPDPKLNRKQSPKPNRVILVLLLLLVAKQLMEITLVLQVKKVLKQVIKPNLKEVNKMPMDPKQLFLIPNWQRPVLLNLPNSACPRLSLW